MKERPLDLSTNNDPTLIVLGEDEKKDLLTLVRDIGLALSQMNDGAKTGTLDKGYCETLCSLSEGNLKKVLDLLDYDSTLQKEYEERYEKVRSLNFENRALRKQLGDKVSADDVRECLKNMEREIRDWWNEEGLGYVSKIEFGTHVIRMELGGSVDAKFDKEQCEKLKSIGYQLVPEDGGGSCNLSCDEVNVALLVGEVEKRFPSVSLFGIDTYYGRRSKYGIIRKAEFYIHSYDCVFKMKEEKKDESEEDK